MNDLQKKLLELLVEIDGICKKNNITYYIDGGSAIGAIRHNGFIPWDDDIDIVMTRDNYNKFYKALKTQLPSNRKFECFEDNPKYTMLYSRYCDCTTTSILRTSMLDVFESGVFIDVFILDPIPNESRKRKKFLKLFYSYCEYVNPYYYDRMIHNNYYDVLKLRILGFILGRKKLHRYIKKKLFSYDEKECKDYFFRFDLFQFIYPKDYFLKPRYMKFETFKAPVPTEIEEYLKIHYGNTWMLIPDHDNQELHNVVTNLNVPYQKFKNDYIKFVPKDAIKNYKKFHWTRLKAYKLNDKINKEKIGITLTEKEIKINFELSKYDIKKIFEKENYIELNNIFSEYYKEQLNKSVIKYNKIIDIFDNTYYAIYALIINGEYYKAKKLMKLHNNKYEDLLNKINATEKLNDHYYKKELKKYYGVLEDNYSNNSEIIDFIEGKVKLLISKNKIKEAETLIEESLKKYTKTDFLLKYKADILFNKNKSEAIKIYKDVINSTNNGLLILEIKQVLGENKND